MNKNRSVVHCSVDQQSPCLYLTKWPKVRKARYCRHSWVLSVAQWGLCLLEGTETQCLFIHSKSAPLFQSLYLTDVCWIIGIFFLLGCSCYTMMPNSFCLGTASCLAKPPCSGVLRFSLWSKVGGMGYWKKGYFKTNWKVMFKKNVIVWYIFLLFLPYISPVFCPTSGGTLA